MNNLKIIDYMKFFMSMVVVAIHAQAFDSFEYPIIDKLFGIIAYSAVPFFFISSGFLMFYNKPTDKIIQSQICLKSIKKVSRLYIFWTILYLPLTIYGFLKEGLSFHTSILVFARNFLLTGENYYSWILWYCQALIVGILLIWLCKKIGFGVYSILLISFVFFLIGQTMDYLYESSSGGYLNLYYKLFGSTRNGIFTGFFAVTLGMYTACEKRESNRFNLLLLLIGSVIGLYAGLPLSIFTAFALFLITIHSQTIGKGNSILYREAGVIIYFIHMYVLFFIQVAFNIRGQSMVLYILTLCITLLITYSLLRMRTRHVYRLLFC